MNKVQLFTQQQTKQNAPRLRSGDTVRVHERISERGKERIQVFEGLVIARKHGTTGPNSTFTVRKVSHGVGVEKTFPLHSPAIQKIEVVKHDKVRRAKLYYVRDLHKKKKKKKASKMLGMVYEEEVAEEPEVAEEAVEETVPEVAPEEVAENTEETSVAAAPNGSKPRPDEKSAREEQPREEKQDEQPQESPKEEPAMEETATEISKKEAREKESA